jgi:hypothetical protein
MADRERSAEGWAIAKVVESREEAALVTGFIKSNGIPAEVESLYVEELPVTVGELAEVRVWVPREQLAEAVELLAQQEREAAAAPAEDAGGS